ncbi:RNA polymerase sigma factor [Luteolibacter soli]|uniref:Sigma-70 family RNA polymerase sigma factor n=1 Tax=Luteolibacter soli TaxID=3135280 RepID=A0ABU9AZ27_9BACT
MNALTDQELLREYAASRSDSAFRELVRRHIDLVHSAARRLVRDSHTAQDVTQAVFTALSKDARKVSSHPVLAGWLHKTTRHLSTNVIRADARRRVREQQAIAMNAQAASDSEPEPVWADIASHLDAVLGELSESDRDAVILRFFEKRSAKEIGCILGITAEAAQKRVNRAIERLRESFARRGVAGSGAGLTGVIGSNAVQAAPAGLTAAITAGVIAGSIANTTTTSILMTTLSKMLLPTAVVALAGTWLVQNREAERLRAEIAPAMQVQAANLPPSSVGFARVGADPSETGNSVGIGVGIGEASSGNEDTANGGGGGFSVVAGAMLDGEWSGPGPGPEPVALDKKGRPTTDMVETLELTDEEVAALETAIRRIRDDATGDFVKRVKLTSSGNKDDGDHYLYQAPARTDEGKIFFDAFAKAFADVLGESRGRKLTDAMTDYDFLGGMGKYDLEFDFCRTPEREIRVKAWYRKPGTTEDVLSRQCDQESFEEDFGKVFEFPDDGGSPSLKVPAR